MHMHRGPNAFLAKIGCGAVLTVFWSPEVGCRQSNIFGRRVSWRNEEKESGLCWDRPTGARPSGSGSIIEEWPNAIR